VSTKCSLGFNQAPAQVARPGRQTMDQKHGFQQGQVAGQRGVRQAGVAAHVARFNNPMPGGQQLQQIRRLCSASTRARSRTSRCRIVEMYEANQVARRSSVSRLGCLRITAMGQSRCDVVERRRCWIHR